MTQERREQLAQQLSEELRGLEDQQIARIGRIWESALRQTIRRVMRLLDGIEAQPEYDPITTPGAFAGSTPDGPVPITPTEKNQAALYLEGQLMQDLRRVLTELSLTPQQEVQLEEELATLFNRAQDIGTEYALQLTRDDLAPALRAVQRPPERDPVLEQWPDREQARYQEGQRFSRLFDMAGSIAAAERDFRSLAMNYRRQRDIATDAHVAASKHYYFKWWRHWGETVSFLTARQMASGPDPRRLKRELQKAIPNVNEAFRNRAETIARTETLMASGEAQERTYRKLRVGFVQYVATLDDRTCEFCAPRAGCLYWIGSVKTPIHPNCVLPGTEILPGHLIAATRMIYRGDVVTIRTKAGRHLACTRHHLVASTRGWVAAHALNRGDQVLAQTSELQPVMANPDLATAPALIEDLFQATLAASKMPPVRMPVAPVHFHGDGAAGQGQVDVVWADRELMDYLVASSPQQLGDLPLVGADAQGLLEAGLSPQDLALLTFHAALGGFVGRGDLRSALLGGHLNPSELVRCAGISWRDPHFDQPTLDGSAADIEMIGQLVRARAGLVTTDEVVEINVDSEGHDGYVYDLTTLSGMYVANGILTHNCRCDLAPVTLESLVLQNAFSEGEDGTWEAEARATAAAVQRHFEELNGEGAAMRPIGGPGQGRGPRDFPLMEKTALPQTKARPGIPSDDPRNAGSRPWPSGDPVWCPRRGWLDPNVRIAYEAVAAEVRDL